MNIIQDIKRQSKKIPLLYNSFSQIKSFDKNPYYLILNVFVPVNIQSIYLTYRRWLKKILTPVLILNKNIYIQGFSKTP